MKHKVSQQFWNEMLTRFEGSTTIYVLDAIELFDRLTVETLGNRWEELVCDVADNDRCFYATQDAERLLSEIYEVES